MPPRLRLAPSKAQRAAGIADGTAQGIDGHVSDPPKVILPEVTTGASMQDHEDEDDDDLALATQGTGITLDEDDVADADIQQLVKAPIPPGSRKYVSSVTLKSLCHFTTYNPAQDTCGAGN